MASPQCPKFDVCNAPAGYTFSLLPILHSLANGLKLRDLKAHNGFFLNFFCTLLVLVKSFSKKNPI